MIRNNFKEWLENKIVNESTSETTDPRFGSTCPHCGSTETVGARSIIKNKDGSMKGYANAHCNSCNNGFGFKYES